MSALEEILKRVDSNIDLVSFRKALVTPRGTIFNGKMPESMKLETTKPESSTSDIPNLGILNTAKPRPIKSLSLNTTSAKTGGFIFNSTGTTKLISKAANDAPIHIFEDFRSDFLFRNDEDASRWTELSEIQKKRFIKDNVNRMLKETSLQYRTHGDRLHYLTIGKVVTEAGGERNVYPLFCFSCEETYMSSLSVEVSTIGFTNFILDEKLLDGALVSIVKAEEVVLDNKDFPSLLNRIEYELPRRSYSDIDKITVDPTYSAISIVTGFETEYLDKAWSKLSK